MIALPIILALIGIPTIAALTTGSALTMGIAWSQVAVLGVNAVKIAGKLPPLQFQPLPPLPHAQRGKRVQRGRVVAVVQGGPGGWGRAPVHFRYEP
jgi:hypothetical protein